MYSDVFCRVYDALGWNYYPEAFGQELLEWLRREKLQVKRSLDLACGTGVLCRVLRGGGIEAAGTDLSPGMIAIAREADPRGSYSVGDMVQGIPAGPWDLVTCTGDSLNHLHRLEDVAAVLDHVAKQLRPGGWFLFDLLNEREISDSEPFEIPMEDGTAVWFQMNRAGAEVQLRVRFGHDREQIIRETVHDVEAVCRLLRRAGLELCRCGHSLTDCAAARGTTWFIIGRKPNG